MLDCLLKNRDNIQNRPLSTDWSELSSLHKLFEPFQKAIAILGGDSFTSASSVLPLVAYLRQQMSAADDDSSYVQEFKRVFLSQLNSYVSNTLQCEHLQFATALDIRYKRLLSLPSEKRTDVWASLKSVIGSMVKAASANSGEPASKKPRTSLLSLASDDGKPVEVENETQPEVYLSEFEVYKHLPQINDDDQCPLQWWKENSATYPNLSKLAKRYLAITATSVPCEQLFSNSAEELNRKRSALLPDHVQYLLSLSDWLSEKL